MNRFRSAKQSHASILALILAISFSCNTPSKTQSHLSKEALKEADKKMEAYVEEGKLSGISLLILKDGEVAHQKTFGMANIEEERPLESGTLASRG